MTEMTRRWRWITATVLLIAGASPVRADALKEAIYVLGVHLGNANGVLYSLNNSYDKSVKAHPGAVPLLSRQIAFTSDLAAALGLETDYLARLDADLALGRMSFAQMAARFEAATERLQKDVSKQFRNNSGAVFKLGAVTAKAGGVAQLVNSLLPKDQAARRPAAATWASYTVSTVVDLGLDKTEGIKVGPAQEFVRRAFSGPLPEAVAAADLAVSTWQADFGSAPAWKFGPETPFQPQVRKPAPVKPLPANVFAQPPVKGRVAQRTPAPAPGHAPAKPGRGFAGTWTTNWGDMTLTGSGDRISGTYSHSQGNLQGAVTGNVLRFHWTQKGNGNKGAGKFLLSADGKTFSGSWNYEDDPDKPGSSWTGSRK